MAVNKRKVLDAARKYAQKGAKEKALKEYHTLLKLDPRDAKLHLEIGDCYRRWGQIDEAVTQYARVAEQYKGDGFDARAVAVFKQILNLDPKRYTAYVSLAELYQRMGLDAEALGALQSAADGYHQEGQKREALDLLRRMATLDPTNTTSRLKVAELLRQEDMEADAIAEYEAVAAELSKQGATESFLSVQEKILELQPDRADVLGAIAHGLIELKKPERAEPFAKRALDKDPEEAGTYELLCDIYTSLGKDDELATTTRQLAQIYRERGDEDKARELTQRIPGAFQLDAAGGAAPAVDQTESAFLRDDEILEDDFLASDKSEMAEPVFDDELAVDEELDLGDESEELLLDDDDDEVADDEPAPPRPAPQGDPEQLFAEASVYLRYGKRDQAIASLEAVLEQEPEHRAALGKLGDAYAEADDNSEAVVYWTRAAKLAQADHDEEAFEVLHDRIAAIDADAADSLRSAAPAADAPLDAPGADVSSAAEVTQPDVDTDADFELDVDVDLDEPDDPADVDEFEIDLSIDEDDDLDMGDTAEPGVEDDGFADDAIAFDAEDDGEVAIDLEAEDPPETAEERLQLDEDADRGAAEAEGLQLEDNADDLEAGADLDEDTDEIAVDVDVDLEEIDVDVDLDDDDDESVADEEIDEIEIDGDDEAAAAADGDDDETEEDLQAELDDGEEALAADSDARAASSVPAAPEARSDESAGNSISSLQRVSEDLEEAEFYYQQELHDEAEAIYRRVLKTQPDHPSALMRLGEIAVAKGDAADAVAADQAAGQEQQAAQPLETRIEEDVEDTTEEEPLAAMPAAAEGPRSRLAGDDRTEVEEMDLPDDSEPVVHIDVPPAERPRLRDLGANPADADLAAEETTAEFPTPDFPDDGADSDVDDTQSLFEEEEEAAAPLAAASESDDEGGMFDLAAELRDVIEEVGGDAEGGAESAAAPASTVEDGFASIFADFKQGVSATLSEDDYETRYDLGIAYREMELYADAISEFQHCLESRARKVSSLHLMGLCALDLGQATDAASHLQQALASEELEPGYRAGLHFDLGRAFEAAGDRARARASYESAIAADPELPGVAQRLAELEGASGEEPIELATESADAGFESFDDLMSDDEERTEPEPAETFESFDDVITAADGNRVEEAGDAEADESPKQARRKKISFV